MISTASRRPAWAVPWLPICVATFFFFASSRIMRASWTDHVNGFWVKQCLPRLIAKVEAGACVWSGVLTVTASISVPISSSIWR